jgi:3-deoxy-D-manno-octulosonic-acid transferase
MTGIYNLSIALYVLLIRMVSPFNKKAALWINGRKDIFKKLQTTFSDNTKPVVWFHVASLGEFEQARTVIEAFRALYPNHRILLTFFSPSGYEIRKNYTGADDIFYLPADTRKNAQQFLCITKPELVLFVKYEFWFHYLDEVHKRKIPTLLFSAIFRRGQPFFSKYTSFYKNILSCFTWLFVQDNTSQELLKTIKLNNTSVIGDTRFDRVKQLCDNKKELSIAQIFKNGKQVFIIGSAWKEDMEVLIPFINNPEFKELKFIIAPHEIHPDELKNWQDKINKSSILYSDANENNVLEKDVLIINNIGMLSSLYQYAEYAWIGGAYGKGLHNILEAATFGMPIFFGTNYQKFREAKELIKEGVAFSVKDLSDFMTSFLPVWKEDANRKQLAENSRNYIKNNTGATEAILKYISTLLTTSTKA